MVLLAIPRKPQPIYYNAAQSISSDLTHFYICDRGLNSMNFGESRFEKY